MTSNGRWAALGWCAAGFVAGIAFWHTVGFWGIVSTAVLGDAGGRTAVARPAMPPAAEASPIETGSLADTVKPACIALALDRAGGVTREQPCPAATFHHRNAGLGVKDNREDLSGPPPNDWAIRLQPSEDPPDAR